MKVFISWSGDISHETALAFKGWLPSVIQSIESFVSSEDIAKGGRWTKEIERELQESRFGLVCVNPLNMERPWLVFEAGALSNSLGRGRVCPFLLGMQRADLGGPLSQFQNTVFDKEDCWKLVGSLNECCEDAALDEARLQNTFDMWWPRLEEELGQIKERTVKEAQADGRQTVERPEREVLEELLELTRAQTRIVSSSIAAPGTRADVPSGTPIYEGGGGLNIRDSQKLGRALETMLQIIELHEHQGTIPWADVVISTGSVFFVLNQIAKKVALPDSLSRLFTQADRRLTEMFARRQDRQQPPRRRQDKVGPIEESIDEA